MNLNPHATDVVVVTYELNSSRGSDHGIEMTPAHDRLVVGRFVLIVGRRKRDKSLQEVFGSGTHP
jgi:hypothetical protein